VSDTLGVRHRVSGVAYSANVTEALTLQMLTWLDEHPRSYADALETWKTSCPRLSIWEDALADGLLAVRGGTVLVTGAGRDRLRATG
jgi:hypothetical protein